MMRFERPFNVKAPIERVAAFHRRSANMAAITPPPIIVQIHHAPEEIQEGTDMEFTLWLGPLPIRWLARMEQVSRQGFVDRQLKGPFRQWVHDHRFESIDEANTRVIDSITFALRPHLLLGPVGLVLRIGLPFLFAFRAWRTRRLLETIT